MTKFLYWLGIILAIVGGGWIASSFLLGFPAKGDWYAIDARGGFVENVAYWSFVVGVIAIGFSLWIRSLAKKVNPPQVNTSAEDADSLENAIVQRLQEYWLDTSSSAEMTLLENAFLASIDDDAMKSLMQISRSNKYDMNVRKCAVHFIVIAGKDDPIALRHVVGNFVHGVNPAATTVRAEDGDKQAHDELILFRVATESLKSIGVEFVADKGEAAKILLEAVIKSRSDEVERILQSGIDPDIKTSEGTSLMRGICTSHRHRKEIEVVKTLLKYGANPNQTKIDIHPAGSTKLSALMLAIIESDVQMVDALIEGGARIDLKVDGWTALMRAARLRTAHKVELLLKSGADPNIKLEDGNDAISIAKHWGKHWDGNETYLALKNYANTTKG